LLDLNHKKLTLYPFNITKDAEGGLKKLEKERGTDSSIDDVLVAASSLDQIKRSYKNYFFDTELFRQSLAEFIA